MTKDQKTLLRSLAVFIGFKAIFWGSVVYSSRHYRKQTSIV